MDRNIPVKTGISLCTRVEGEGVPLLLVMGIRLQLVHWPLEFCAALRGAGFQLIRFDNRDTGASTKLSDHGTPTTRQLAPGRLGAPPPYTLSEMADDTLGLLDALGLDDAHIVGVSMGGMIAQEMALRAPERFRSLTLIMTTCGDIYLPRLRALLGLLRPHTVDGPDDLARAFLSVQEALRGGPAAPPFSEADRARMETVAQLAWERDPHPGQAGFLRQLAAITSAPPRREALSTMQVPTRIIHGACDPLLPPRAGYHLAKVLPNADLHLINGMGHGMPDWAREPVAALVAEHAWKHERARR